MDQPCNQEHLVQIAKDLTQWQVVAYHLGLKEAEVEEIDDMPGSLPEKRIKMLLKWKNKLEDVATYRRLSECLSSMRRNDLAQKVIELHRVEASLTFHSRTFQRLIDVLITSG